MPLFTEDFNDRVIAGASSLFLDSMISAFCLGASYVRALKFYGIDSKGKLLLFQVIYCSHFLYAVLILKITA